MKNRIEKKTIVKCRREVVHGTWEAKEGSKAGHDEEVERRREGQDGGTQEHSPPVSASHSPGDRASLSLNAAT